MSVSNISCGRQLLILRLIRIQMWMIQLPTSVIKTVFFTRYVVKCSQLPGVPQEFWNNEMKDLHSKQAQVLH